jgi:prepilin-type N-terminal cleavage/methylation domain-containing protein
MAEKKKKNIKTEKKSTTKIEKKKIKKVVKQDIKKVDKKLVDNEPKQEKVKKESRIKKKIKKGFTLIEIIAVVVILGVLALIIVPSVSGYIANTRKETYKAHEKTMTEAAKSMTIETINGKDDFTLPKTGSSEEVYLDELIEKEYTNELQDPASNGMCNESMSYVKIVNTGESNYEYKACLYCGGYITDDPDCADLKDVEDTTPPTCGTITGESTDWTNNSRTISIGCTDAESGCVRNKVSKVFNASTKEGTIQISNKKGLTRDCPVKVYVDKSAPTCELVINNGTAESTGWLSGRDVTVSFKAGSRQDEGSGVLTYGIGTSVKNRVYNKKETYSIENVSGTTTVIGYVKDNAGNEGVCYKTVTTGLERPIFDVRYGYQVYPQKDRFELSGVDQIDANKLKTTSENPTITFTNMEYYKNVTSMTISFMQNITNATDFELTAGGKSVTGYALGSRRVVFYLEKEPLLESILSSPTYTIKLGKDKDVTYQIDRIEIEQKEGNISSKYKVAVDLITRKQVVKTTAYSFDGGTSWQANYYNLIDATTSNVNNKGKIKNDIPLESELKGYSIVKGDNVAPTLSISASSTEWINENVILTATAKDSGTGIYGYVWTTNSNLSYYDNEWQYLDSPQAEFTKAETFTSNGTYYFYTKDFNGNVTSKSYNITTIDKEPPSCTSSGDSTSWTTGNRTITYGCSDPGVSGCDPSYSGGSKTYSSSIWTDTIPEYTIKDRAGNTVVCPARTANIYIDKTAPSCGSVSGDSTSWTNANRTINQNCSDGHSGCVKTTYSTTYSSSTQTASIEISDNVGNKTTCSYNVYVDKNKPSCSVSKSNAGSESGVNTSVSCSDSGGSGVSSCPGGHSGLKSGTSYTVTDRAGNSNTCSVGVEGYNCNGYSCNAHNCNCSDCYYGSNTCKYGCSTCSKENCTYTNYHNLSSVYCPNGGTPTGMSHNVTSYNSYSVQCRKCTTSYYSCNCSNCKTGSNTCSYGCSTCYDTCYRTCYR